MSSHDRVWCVSRTAKCINIHNDAIMSPSLLFKDLPCHCVCAWRILSGVRIHVFFPVFVFVLHSWSTWVYELGYFTEVLGMQKFFVWQNTSTSSLVLVWEKLIWWKCGGKLASVDRVLDWGYKAMTHNTCKQSCVSQLVSIWWNYGRSWIQELVTWDLTQKGFL